MHANHKFNSPGLKKKIQTVSYLCLNRHLIIKAYDEIIQCWFNVMLTSHPECSVGELLALGMRRSLGRKTRLIKEITVSTAVSEIHSQP